MIKAVLFDLDGVLVDTEPLAMNIVRKVCKEIGLKINSGELKNFVGITNEKFYTELFKNRGLKNKVKNVLKKHYVLYEESLRNGFKSFKYVKYLLNQLKSRGLKLALVSGSTSKQVFIILNHLRILNNFDVIISKEDTRESKPSPEGYSLAAQKLGVKAKECVVLEDAEVGIMSAKKAGMRAIGVRSKYEQDLSLADAIVNNLSEVENIIKKYKVLKYKKPLTKESV